MSPAKVNLVRQKHGSQLAHIYSRVAVAPEHLPSRLRPRHIIQLLCRSAKLPTLHAPRPKCSVRDCLYRVFSSFHRSRNIGMSRASKPTRATFCADLQRGLGVPSTWCRFHRITPSQVGAAPASSTGSRRALQSFLLLTQFFQLLLHRLLVACAWQYACSQVQETKRS